jgi:2'-5' RNA ligase
MIALVPRVEDAQRLAVESGLPADELHVTLLFLGDADMYEPSQVQHFAESIRQLVSEFSPVDGSVFSVNFFNPDSENPCVVLGVSGAGVDRIHRIADDRFGKIFPQHRPWVAHLTVAYTDDLSTMAGLTDRMGPVIFDRVRLDFGDAHMDFPFIGETNLATVTASVNSSSWKKMPVAGRETEFNADAAVERIKEWAGPSVDKFNSAFLWRNSKGPANNVDSYRLPIADVVNGKLAMIPHAVFSAAAILSGAHGGLAGVVGDEEKLVLKGVVTDIYDVLREAYGDPRTTPPWLRGGNDRDDVTASAVGEGEWSMDFFDVVTASVNSSGWSSMPIAVDDRSWDSGSAKSRVFAWADGDFGKFRKAFLWFDASQPELKGSYKLPIADIIDGELTIVPHAVNAVAAVLGGARGGVDIPDADMDRVAGVVKRIQSRMHGDDSVEASVAPVAPPASWFAEPTMNARMPFTVFPDGRVAGLIAAFGVCHAGIGNECVMAPRTMADYKYFKNGQVLTADGSMIKVGKITQGTGHAGPRMRYQPAVDHYDNTGTVSAVVNVGENRFGIWAAGALVSDLSDAQAAELRRSPISGDWRLINGSLELVAALAVNVPGFPILASLETGEVNSITAAGVVLADGAVANENLNAAEEDMTRMVNDLDVLLSGLLAKGRARKFNKAVQKLDERGK